MRSSGLVLLALFAPLSLCGFSCGAFNSAPVGPAITGVDGADTDPVQQGNQFVSGCSAPPVPTGPTYWHVHYSGGSAGDVSFLWPTSLLNGNIATIGYYFAGDDPINVKTQATNAINAWNNALQRDKASKAYVQIALQATTDSHAPVTIFGPNNAPFALNPAEAGATVYGIIQSPYSNLSSVQIALDTSGGDNAIYGEALHELGHSLGLRHNQYQGSVMWPTVN